MADIKIQMQTDFLCVPKTELAFRITDRFISIRETLNDIVEDLKENPFDNGAKGNIRNDNELIPIDYDVLLEKVEAANCIAQ